MRVAHARQNRRETALGVFSCMEMRRVHTLACQKLSGESRRQIISHHGLDARAFSQPPHADRDVSGRTRRQKPSGIHGDLLAVLDAYFTAMRIFTASHLGIVPKINKNIQFRIADGKEIEHSGGIVPCHADAM